MGEDPTEQLVLSSKVGCHCNIACMGLAFEVFPFSAMMYSIQPMGRRAHEFESLKGGLTNTYYRVETLIQSLHTNILWLFSSLY
jgi:hypothetical protein